MSGYTIIPVNESLVDDRIAGMSREFRGSRQAALEFRMGGSLI